MRLTRQRDEIRAERDKAVKLTHFLERVFGGSDPSEARGETLTAREILDTAIPDVAAQRAGLAKSPGGFTGEFLQFGRWYAFAVVPLRRLGDDTHALIVRSDPV